MHGVLVIDKPGGLSSTTVVDKVRRALGGVKAGHGGTLDPIATGVLPICLGSGTKIAQFLLADDKAYEAEGLLGVTTDTLDRTGRVLDERPVDAALGRDAVLAVLARFTGELDQVPPMYSAIKLGGQRLYHAARAGQDVERAPRRIRIDRLALVDFAPPRFRIAVDCSKGTYIRSLVADIGEALGPGAHLTELRRTRSGRFTLADAVALDALDPGKLIPVAEATDLPRLAVTDPELVAMIFNGLQLPIAAFGAEGLARFQLMDGQGRLLAIAHPAEDGRTVYDRAFPELSRGA